MKCSAPRSIHPLSEPRRASQLCAVAAATHGWLRREPLVHERSGERGAQRDLPRDEHSLADRAEDDRGGLGVRIDVKLCRVRHIACEGGDPENEVDREK